MFVRRAVWVALLVMLTAGAGQAQSRYDAGNEHYEQAQLPNGLRVYMAEDHRAPRVAIVIRYPVGERHDPKEARGTAELLSSLLPQLKTSHLPRGAADLIEAAGFYPWEVKASARDDDTSITVVVPAAAVDLALFIEAERMGFAADGMTNEGMSAEAKQIVSKFASRTGGDGTVGLLSALAYGPQHSFAALANPRDFSKIDLGWLRRRLRRFYNVGVASLSIVGDFDSKRLLPVVGRIFGLLKGQSLPPLPPDLVVNAPHRGELRAADVTSATIWSWRTPRYLSADDIALDVVARYLKHRLSQSLASGQKRAGVFARQMSIDAGSLFWLHLPASSESERAGVEQAARAEIDAIASGHVDEQGLELAKASIIREIADNMDSLTSRAHFLATYALHDGKLDQFDAHLQSYATLNATRFSDVVQRLLGRPDGTLIEVHDPEAHARVLTGFEPATFEGVRASDDLVTLDTPAWYKPPTAVAQPRFDTPRLFESNVGKMRLLFMPRGGLPTIRIRVALNWRGHAPTLGGRVLLLNTLLGMRPGGAPILKDRMSDLGADLETSAGDDALALTATTVVNRADSVAAALRETLEQEHLEQAAFDSARDEQVTSMSKKTADATTLLDRWTSRLSYRKGHRYRIDEVDDGARLAAVRSSTLKQLEAFWKEERRADHVTVGIVGPLDEARAQELARLIAPRFRAGRTAAPVAAPRLAPHTFLVVAPQETNVRVRFSWPMAAWGSQGFVDAIGLRWTLARRAEGVLSKVLAENGVKNLSGWDNGSFVKREDGGITLTVTLPKAEVAGLFKALGAYIARLGQGDISWNDEQEARRASVQWVTGYFDDAKHCLSFVSAHADLEASKQAGDDLYILSQRIGRSALAKAAGLLAPERATVIVYGPVGDLEQSLRSTGFGPTSVVLAADAGKGQ